MTSSAIQSRPRASGRLVAYIGSYGSAAEQGGGGIHVLSVSPDGREIAVLSRVRDPLEAGYLVHAPATGTLYAVDERKNDGRGPVAPAARVHALKIDPCDGSLTPLNSQLAPGPRPTFLDIDADGKILLTANHGDFQHVERVVRNAEGEWVSEYIYDDSTVILYRLEDDGRVGRILDLEVLGGHGPDPNHSPQNGGHAQASAHAHCAVIDPSGRYVLVCDKGTDRIYVYRLGRALEQVFMYQCEAETGPRHVAFDPASGMAFVTYEFSSDLASFAFDSESGRLRLLDRQSTVGRGFAGLNEPAEVRVHPNGRFVYVNNRGEDSVAWFRVGSEGLLERKGHAAIAKSIHPGLAARNFTFDPTGTFMLVADRPAHLVRSYAVDANDGSLQPLTQIRVLDPAFVAFVELPPAAEALGANREDRERTRA